MKNNQSNQTDQLKHRTNKLPANSSTNRQKTRTYNPTTNLKTTNKNIHQMKNLLAMLLIVFGLTVQAQKPVPSDPKATPEAVKLYQNMMNLQHKGLMFGHQDALTGGSAWDVSSKKAVASMLPGGEKHELYLQYLDKLADFMLSLKTDQGKFIPVLFRPFHEHTGSWFFWGKDLCSVDEYRTLWRFSVNYLRETRNVHHLLYTYSTDRFATPEEYLERYPGDDLVDIVAFDLYDRGSDYSATLSNCAKRVTKIAAEKGKIGAVSEAGGPISRNQEWWTNVLLKSLSPYDLSYVLVWRNPFNMPKEAAFGPYKGCPSEQDFVKFHNDPKTLFLKDIQ